MESRYTRTRITEGVCKFDQLTKRNLGFVSGYVEVRGSGQLHFLHLFTISAL
jgi:hypothetical protein